MQPEPLVPPWLSTDLASHWETLASDAGGLHAADVAGWVTAVCRGHEAEVELGSLVLYAGTNAMSPGARRMLATSVGSLPSMGPPGEKYQTGTRWIERLEVAAAVLAARAFGARFAEVRLPSGSLANLAVYAALAEPGDTVLVLPQNAGGHTSHHAEGMPGVRGLRVVEMPFDGARMNVDLDGFRSALERHRPKLVVAGASLMLFPHPVAEMAAAAHGTGARLLYDAAHVAGLVAAGRFREPLREGADVMTCSTYKSFGGPPGGLVLTNDPEVAAAIERAAYPGMTANYDASRLASLCVACAEVIEFWPSYVDACLTNAGHLAKALGAEGFEVVARDLGATESHHVALDVGSLGGGRTVAGRLEAARILTSAIGLPGDGPVGSPGGLRIGVQEVTRFGLGPAEMEQAARWMSAAVLHGASPDDLAGEVARLREGFDTVGYCFTPSGG